MPCDRKKFSGAKEIRVRSEQGNHTLWVTSPRDEDEEAEFAAALEEERLRWVNRDQRSKQQLTWLVTLMATNQWPSPAVQTLLTTVAESEASAEIQALTPSTSPTPVTQASITTVESQVRTPSEASYRTPESILSNTTSGSQTTSSAGHLGKSHTHSLPPSDSPPRKRARVELGLESEGSGVAVQAVGTRVIISEGARGQEEGEKQVLWKLVDVLMEQKELMQGKIKSLEWKISRGSGVQQGGGIDGVIEGLAVTERIWFRDYVETKMREVKETLIGFARVHNVVVYVEGFRDQVTFRIKSQGITSCVALNLVKSLLAYKNHSNPDISSHQNIFKDTMPCSIKKYHGGKLVRVTSTAGSCEIWVSEPRDEAAEAQLVYSLVVKRHSKAEDENRVKHLMSRLAGVTFISKASRSGLRKRLGQALERLRISQANLDPSPSKIATNNTSVSGQPFTTAENQPEAAEIKTLIPEQSSTSIETPADQAQLSVTSRIKAEAELYSSPLMQRQVSNIPRAPYTPRTSTALQARQAEIDSLKQKGAEEKEMLRELATVVMSENRKMKRRMRVMKEKLKMQRALLKRTEVAKKSTRELEEKRKALLEKLGLEMVDDSEQEVEFS